MIRTASCRGLRPSAASTGWSVLSALACRASACPTTATAASPASPASTSQPTACGWIEAGDRGRGPVEILHPGPLQAADPGLEPGEVGLPVAQPHVVGREGGRALGRGGEARARVQGVADPLPVGELVLSGHDAHHPHRHPRPGGLLGRRAFARQRLEHRLPLRSAGHRQRDHRAQAHAVVTLQRERGQRLERRRRVGHPAGHQLGHPAQAGRRHLPHRERAGADPAVAGTQGLVVERHLHRRHLRHLGVAPQRRQRLDRVHDGVVAVAGYVAREGRVGAPPGRGGREHEPAGHRDEQAEQHPGPPLTAEPGHQHQPDSPHRPSRQQSPRRDAKSRQDANPLAGQVLPRRPHPPLPEPTPGESMIREFRSPSGRNYP